VFAFVNGLTGSGTGRDGMQSEEEMFSANSDSAEEDDEDSDEYSLNPCCAAAAATKSVSDCDTGDDDFAYKVLTADELVQHMVDCIKDVNTVVQVGSGCYNVIFSMCQNSADLVSGFPLLYAAVLML